MTEFERGLRAGIDEALTIAKEQAMLMADLAIEGLPENAPNRESMEAALTRFSHALAVTLEELTSIDKVNDRLPYDLRLQIGKALDRLVCAESTTEQVDKFISVFADFGLSISSLSTPTSQL